MRIAVSGSHSLGKSTVVNDWVARHPHFKREEEPYRALGLHGPYEILFRDASTKLHNGIQLYYNIGRVHRYADSSSDVIFDRSPVDYVAYSQYTADQGSTDIDAAFVESMVPGVREIDKCHVRKMGLEYYVDIHVLVDGNLSVREGHGIAHDVKDRLRTDHPAVRDVLVHIEPM